MNNFYPTKLFRLFVFVLVAGAIAVGCTPESEVTPRTNDTPSLSAFGPGDTVHQDPDTICGQIADGDLYDALGRTGSGNIFGADIYGTWKVIATPSEMVLQITLNRGWFIADYAIYHGSAANVPTDGNGNPDYENFPYNAQVRPVRNIWEVRWPIGPDMVCPNTAYIFFQLTVVEIDFLGNPYNPTPVWGGNTPYGTAGGRMIEYCATPCRPPCSIPTPSPGDDLSEWECQNNSNKVTVCHIPPGNPANMHEICISTNALPAHVQEFKPWNNQCMGHHSGCHIGPCDPCGPNSTSDWLANYNDPCPGNGGNGGGRNP